MSRLKQPKFETSIRIYGSDILHEVAYDATWCILDVTLKSGSKYRYRDVWASDFAKLITAKSAGTIYNNVIKKQFYTGLPRRVTKLRT